SAMQSLYNKLTSIGINPCGDGDSSSRSSDEKGDALKSRIINRARELRRNWGLTVEGDEEQAIVKEETIEYTELEYSEPKDDSVSVHENLSEKNYIAANPVIAFSIAKTVQDWASKLGKDAWFSMAHYAKEKDQFSPKARSFLYQVGVLVASGKALTEKQEKWAKELHQQLVEMGFSAENARKN
ncbi:hypothetical protein L0152_30885, partial [bacterium]|nr:hypothetical protein [bacterium]